jgi:hypothetical protein
MAYKIDPDVPHTVAKQVVGLPLEGGELIAGATEMLAAEYPDLIDPSPGRWVGSKAGGILGKVRFLYFSPREYIVLFGSPTAHKAFRAVTSTSTSTSSCSPARSTHTTWSPTRCCVPANTRASKRVTRGD